jgi:AcrR family transcriptional regulator
MDSAIIWAMGTSPEIATDGRLMRSERSREAIVQAMLELVGEGILQPTAQQVALRADVGVRTVFRHFSDMETLFATMNERLREQASPLFVDAPQTGPCEARVEALLARRLEIFALLGPYLRSSAIQRWRSAFLQREHERMVRIYRRDLLRWLPELEGGEPAVADALELLLSFEAWDRLRTDQGLATARAARALRRAVFDLMAPWTSRSRREA